MRSFIGFPLHDYSIRVKRTDLLELDRCHLVSQYCLSSFYDKKCSYQRKEDELKSVVNHIDLNLLGGYAKRIGGVVSKAKLHIQ